MNGLVPGVYHECALSGMSDEFIGGTGWLRKNDRLNKIDCSRAFSNSSGLFRNGLKKNGRRFALRLTLTDGVAVPLIPAGVAAAGRGRNGGRASATVATIAAKATAPN